MSVVYILLPVAVCLAAATALTRSGRRRAGVVWSAGVMGAGLIVQILNATVFLSLDQKWQYIFQGLLIVAAALIYSQVRRTGLRMPGRA